MYKKKNITRHFIIVTLKIKYQYNINKLEDETKIRLNKKQQLQDYIKYTKASLNKYIKILQEKAQVNMNKLQNNQMKPNQTEIYYLLYCKTNICINEENTSKESFK